MKATGIVRRIDELGRIVIPKEIRRTLRIRESDPLEIYTDNAGKIIFKKYSDALYSLVNDKHKIFYENEGGIDFWSCGWYSMRKGRFCYEDYFFLPPKAKMATRELTSSR